MFVGGSNKFDIRENSYITVLKRTNKSFSVLTKLDYPIAEAKVGVIQLALSFDNRYLAVAVQTDFGDESSPSVYFYSISEDTFTLLDFTNNSSIFTESVSSLSFTGNGNYLVVSFGGFSKKAVLAKFSELGELTDLVDLPTIAGFP
jgi:hypothetical protein